MTEDPPTSSERSGLSIEELSARTGTPVRTIREYQTWQVLPPPARVGRRGFYDGSHVRRMEGIARLQERGYSIAAIRDLFEAWDRGAGLRDVLGVEDSIGLPPDEAPVTMTRAQLEELLPTIAASDRLLARACRIGVLHPDGEAFLARSPALVQLLAEAVTGAADRAGSAAAVVVTLGVAGTEAGDDVEALVRRGRVLLARAVATHTIDRVGHHLLERAVDDPEIGKLVEDIRIGSITP